MIWWCVMAQSEKILIKPYVFARTNRGLIIINVLSFSYLNVLSNQLCAWYYPVMSLIHSNFNSIINQSN